MEAVGIVGISVFLLIILLLVGAPVFMSFGAIVLFVLVAFNVNPMIVIPTAFHMIRSVILLAVPFFIMGGGLLAVTGMADNLINFVNSIIGHIRAGLGAVTVGSCAVFGAISGACSATVVAIGTVMIPKMVENGYPRGYATALIASASILGQLIPPSIPMVMFAIMTRQSVPACWLSTVLPGIITIFSFIIWNYFMMRKRPTLVVHRWAGLGKQARGVIKAAYQGAASLVLPFIVLGGVYGGIFTATEAGCTAVVYIILVSFARKTLNLRLLESQLLQTGILTGVLMVVFFFVVIYSRILVLEHIPEAMAAWVTAISPSKYVTLVMINVFLLITGMLMDEGSGTLLAAALIFPITQAIGVHPLQAAAIVGVNLGLGNVTPPCAPILYIAGHVGKSPFAEYVRPAVILMYGGMLPVLIVTTWFPELALFLPRVAGFA